MSRAAVYLGAALAFVSALALMSAQTQTPANQPPAGPQAPGEFRAPSLRDSQTPGTAVIRGRVFAADTGLPLHRVQILATSDNSGSDGQSTTDGEGTYEVKNLRAGAYRLRASKPGYLTWEYGQTRPVAMRSPVDAGEPVQIRDGQTVDKVDLSLPKGGVITGRVLDEFGEPLTDVYVALQRSEFRDGRRRTLATVFSATTNDIGDFRMYGVVPGQYYVSATLRTPGVTDDRKGYATTYFPGTVNPADAQRITVGVGQMLADMNMALVPNTMARVSGVAVDSTSQPLAGVRITAYIQQQAAGFTFASDAITKPDGGFELTGLLQGEYMLTTVDRLREDQHESATTTIAISGEDITGVRLVGVKSSTVSGRLVVDPAASRSLPAHWMPFFNPVRVHPEEWPAALYLANGVLPLANNSRLKADMTFELKVSPGLWRIEGTAGPGWTFGRVRYRGMDVTDSGFEVRPNEDISGIEIEVTDRLTTVSGLITDAQGKSVKHAGVEVFSQDAERWTDSRYVRMLPSDQDGRYTASGLKPGRYYAIALDDIDPGDAGDPEFLDRIRRNATTFSVSDGEAKTVDLRVVAN
jgi:protocatechuate 3,4-dioxygenase beta subunit